MNRLLGLRSVLLLALTVLFPAQAYSHCQIPCGIFDDSAEIQRMLLDATTIEKSATEVTALAGKGDAESQNQLVRWVNNKEHHADNVINTIGYYFLAQRVKPDMEDYQERLVKHHAVMIAAMKTKQTADPKAAETLREAILALKPFYPEPDHDHEH